MENVKFYEDKEANVMLNLIIKLEGFRKIGEDYRHSLKTAYLYNTDTKEYKSVIVDDTDYNYGDGMIDRNLNLDELEALKFMKIDIEAVRQYNKDNNIIDIGSVIEVVKGRKYPKGTIGTVTKITAYKDKYNRYVTDYLFTDSGIKIDIKNVKRIG